MIKTLLLATVADRTDSCCTCLRTIRQFLPDWSLAVVAQGHSAAQIEKMKQAYGGEATWVSLDRRIGPHSAKVVGLNAVPDSDVFCSIDDDMEFLELTNLDPAAQKAIEPSVGFVSAGWMPHESRIRPSLIVQKYVSQPIVYTGGGLVFARKIAQLVAALPDLPYFCDNTEWSVAAYIAGYSNYRWRGSLAIHRVCGTGGRRAWIPLGHRALPSSRYVRLESAKGGGEAYKIPTSGNLTDEAHALHVANKK